MRNPETAKRLQEAMNDINITAKELSDKSGVKEPSISQYIHGVYAPRNKTSVKLANVLGVNPMWLMGFPVPKEEVTVKSISIDELLVEEMLLADPSDVKLLTGSTFDLDKKGEDLELQRKQAYIDAVVQKLSINVKKLNIHGLEKLAERAEELTEVPKYVKTKYHFFGSSKKQ